MIFDKESIKDLLIGSLLLGGGGGGCPKEGEERALSALKLGNVELITIEELKKRYNEGCIVTISGVGSPASDTAYYSDDVYPRILELLGSQSDTPIAGFISCELGASSSFEPFIPAALSGLPIIDAPCDGRAHPLGIMGSLGLESSGLPVIQAAAGGRPEDQTYTELTVKGSVENTAALVRNAAHLAGGAVAVARNPVSVPYLETHAAAGAYAQALQLGHAYRTAATPAQSIEAALEQLNGRILCTGTVENCTLETRNALDYGTFQISTPASPCRIGFCNEYMYAAIGEERLATFPDLITTIETETGRIIASADIKSGMEITVISAPKSQIKLGAGLLNPENYRILEEESCI